MLHFGAGLTVHVCIAAKLSWWGSNQFSEISLFLLNAFKSVRRMAFHECHLMLEHRYSRRSPTAALGLLHPKQERYDQYPTENLADEEGGCWDEGIVLAECSCKIYLIQTGHETENT